MSNVGQFDELYYKGAPVILDEPDGEVWEIEDVDAHHFKVISKRPMTKQELAYSEKDLREQLLGGL